MIPRQPGAVDPAGAVEEALRTVRDTVRATYPDAASVHVVMIPEGGSHEITEVYDEAGRQLNDPEVNEAAEFDDWSPISRELALAAAGAPRAAQGGQCVDCYAALVLPPHTGALGAWRAVQHDTLYPAAQDGQRAVYLWEATTEADHGSTRLGAGVLQLPAGADVDQAAETLQTALQTIAANPDVLVFLIPRDHDGGADATTVGSAVPPAWER